MDLDLVREVFSRGRPVLFLGAGPSMSQGGPSWPKLGEMIANRFHSAETKMDKACDSLCRTSELRREVEEFVDVVLSPIAPGTSLSALLALDWKAVFTSNYDGVPDKVATIAAPRKLTVVDEPSAVPFRSKDDRWLPIYKVMGSCNRRAPDPGAMQLSATDIRRGAEKRRPFEPARVT